MKLKKYMKDKTLKINLDNKLNQIIVEGPLGKLSRALNPLYVKVIDEKNMYFKDKKHYNTFNAHLNNMVKGVKTGFFVELELVGLGYRIFYLDDKKSIGLDLGYSHILKVNYPSDLEVKCTNNTILIFGIDKEQVHSFAAKLYYLKKRDPYKGKGFRFKGEEVKIKVKK